MSLPKAEEFVNAADVCLQHGYCNASASRSYYATFHAAWHALEAAGLRSENWTHEGLQAAFSRELIHRRKLYPASLADYLFRAIVVRHRADYNRENVSATVARRLLDRTREFIERVREVTKA